MQTALKFPPILPRILIQFLAIGIILSFALGSAATVAEPYIPHHWLYGVVPRSELAAKVLRVFLVLTGGLSALWAAVYLVCWPFKLIHHFRAVRQRQTFLMAIRERELSEEANVVRTREKYEAQSKVFARIEYESRFAEAAMQARRAELERQILTAYAHHAVATDFLGTGNETDSLRGFGQQLSGLNIQDIGLLNASRHPTICKLVKQAPRLPNVDPSRFRPPSTPTPVLVPVKDPFYNPFSKLNYPVEQQRLKPCLRNRFFALKRP